MAKETWNNPIDKTVDWGGDASTQGLPVSGEMVQRFIKESLESKVGEFYYDNTNNRYLVFADEMTRDAYLQDPTQTGLIIGTFEAPFNYTAEISLASSAYNAVFLGSAGNYIEFTFDIKNKQGASTGENVIVTYTIVRNAVKQVVTETRKFGDAVRFNVDKYLGEGTNTIMVGVTGQTSLVATSVAVTYQVVNLSLTDSMDISKAYNLADGSQRMEIPFTLSGYGTKIVEWYLDGELLPFVKSEDEVVDVTATRTKYITLSNLQQGTHSLQVRAYTVVNGERFYTDVLYRDIIVFTRANHDVILGIATTIPRVYGVLGNSDNVAIYDMVQYVPYNLRFATYSPNNAASTEVIVSLDGKEVGRAGSANSIENSIVITSTTSGTKTLKLSAGSIVKECPVVVKESDMDIQEIDTALALDFRATGKSNNADDRASWTDGTYTGRLTGFNFNNTSGWVDGRLEMNAGAAFEIGYAPLATNATEIGKTIEIEWSTKNVTNDNAVICDLRGENGVGILITATKVSMISADGVVVETEYKSDENVRIGFVINQAVGTTNKRLSFIYANGVLSRAEQWAETDNYISDKILKFTATAEAEVSLKAIRIYNTALSADNMLNNYTLYRDSVSEMLDVYDRNDVYEEGTTTFSPEKMMGRLPVMIVTGDIPTLENTSDKNTQITVDIEYRNLQEPSRSFTMKNAAMRPQGTSSMGYPKKNFRIYTQELEQTVLYDADGKVVEDRLYAFKEGSQPVNCWCLKADYAESSGTHNTGIARLWNDALYNARVTVDLGKDNEHNIDNEPILRTEAQKAAADAKYPYDVRTTIDGFPILLFYRPSANDDLIFIGKYNFNNDKSTESVFGFKGIPNFNNEKMQCWEVLNNGNPLALFTTADGFDEGWKEAFESRYPDTKTPYVGDLKAFCEWMVNVSVADFKVQKWEHLNVYMMAAYWCYLMRHAAADQFVKNAMFTSEDGQHFYYILYDNDTINGLINTGRLRIKPTDDRQTVDETGSYVFAGHDSRLWNMLENDEEFISIVSAVDNALYSAGISYANTIRIFDEEQASKWVEKVYNQDAQYKYVGPYVEKGINNLFMLQGKRDLHRRWWLAKRFSIYDAKYVSGTYKSQAIEVKCLNGTEAGQQFSIKAGYPLDYGYGINNVPREFGISLNVGEETTFTTREVVNLGDPVRIYAAPHISEVDFSAMSDRLAVVTIANVYDENLGTKLTKLVLGNASKTNAEVSEISGLKQASALEYLDVQGMTKINSLDLSSHQYLKTLKTVGSGVSSVSFAKGAPVERVELPASMRVLNLNQLPYLRSENLILENKANLQSISITACPGLGNDFGFIYEWYASKTTADLRCSLVMDNVDWHLENADEFMELLSLYVNGGTFSVKGKVKMDTIRVEQIYAIRDILGESSFDPDSEFYVDVPPVLQINAEDSVLEGDSLQFTISIYPYLDGQYTWSLESGRSGCSIDNNGLLTTEETSLNTSDIVVKVELVTEGGKVLTATKTVSVVRRTYPQNATIVGNINPLEKPYTYTWETTTEGVNGEFYAEWALSGDVISVVEITSQDNEKCVMGMLDTPTEIVDGLLTLTLKRVYDGSVILTVTKELQAMLEGVIMTSESNHYIQNALYSNGLVANEAYTLKEEAAIITASQLYNALFNMSSAEKAGVTQFNEFQYFTAVDIIPSKMFISWAGLINITLPENLTQIGKEAFNSCLKLSEITIGDKIELIDDYAFYRCSSMWRINSLRKAAPSLGTGVFGEDSYSYTGRSSYSIKQNTLLIPAGATGYGGGQWLNPLQDPQKCGFKIYGKLVIDANNPSATFTVTYTSVDGETKNISANVGTLYLNDIQYDTNVTIRVVSGGIPNEGVEKTFVYNDDNNVHTFTFAREGSWITIDQNVIDSDTMITGDINGEHIRAIRNNSHRYLGKNTADGQMTICQLDDSNSNLYANGSSAVLTGGEGDVFVRLPRFWYASVEKDADVWDIGFYYGGSAPKEDYWKEWDGADLLGAFAQGKKTNKTFSSIAGFSIESASSNLFSFNDCVSYISVRGAGFKEMPMKWYNIISLLYYAQYGTTNFRKKFTEVPSSYSTGITCGDGMNDVSYSGQTNSFLGIEGQILNSVEIFIGNVLVDYVSPSHVWKITEDDGTVRNVSGSGASSGYIMKMAFGSETDLIPTNIDGAGYGSDTTGFGTMFARAASSNRVVSTSLGRYLTANKPNNNSYAHGRLAFRGTIIEETDPEVFKSLTAIG